LKLAVVVGVEQACMVGMGRTVDTEMALAAHLEAVPVGPRC